MVDKTDDVLNQAAVSEDGFDGTSAPSADVSNVAVVKLEDELKKSFIDYAMSVLVDRALPDVRDGLKPVHRRVLYDMYDLKIWHSGQTKKSARVVGDVIGRFHPHGDAAVYETIVRMTQWFSMRAPLIFGQGNFGNIDGDGAAAMRYTEVKMTKIAERMLEDIDKETVDTYPNYDGNEQIPEVLPTRFPNLLVNGSSGIAVGMATNIPTHNLGEVIDGTLAMLENPEIDLEELMRHIPGPDFPTGGYIVGRAGIVDAYRTGKGRCIIRARTHVETDKAGRKTIIVDEIPYVENKSVIVKQIAELVRDKKIEGISEVNDLSDKDNLVRIAIDLKRDAYEEAVLNNLFEKTNLQSSFAINMIALVHNKPMLLSLKDILREFIDFRREVVTRRTVYLLRQDRRKAFLNEGLVIAKQNIRRIVEIITNSENAEEAKDRLLAEPWDGAMAVSIMHLDENGVNVCLPQGINPKAGLHDGKYYLDEMQVKYILQMQLSRLTHIASEQILDEYKKLIENILGYLEILNNPQRLKEVIRDELLAVKEEYNDKRRTDFLVDYGKLSKADFITPRDVIITLSDQGYIKYQDISAFESQKRGGKGKSAAKVKDDDYLKKIVLSNTHHTLLCFTSEGRVFSSVVYNLPTSDNRTWRGRPIQNYFEIEQNEKITSLLSIAEFDENHFLLMATAGGFIKKIRLSSLKKFIERSNSRPLSCLALREGDSLVSAAVGSGDDDVYLFTEGFKALRFCDYYSGSASEDDNSQDDVLEDNAAAQVEIASDNESEDIKAAEVKDRHFGSGVRPSGRGSGTIRGMKLLGDDKLCAMIVVTPDDKAEHHAMILGQNGRGKRFMLEELTLRNRGRQGMTVMRSDAAEKVGSLVGAIEVADGDEYIIITDQGTLIRSPVDENFRLMSRVAMGVIVMRTYEGENIIALEKIPKSVAEASRQTQEGRKEDKKAREEMLKKLQGQSGDEEASGQEEAQEDLQEIKPSESMPEPDENNSEE